MKNTLISILVLTSVLRAAEPPPPQIVRYVAVDNVCAWPNLNVLPDGTIAAIIHNRPSHGKMEGMVECWASRDGEFWEKRGNPAPNDPHSVRMNVAAGLAKNGDLVVICSGWTVDPPTARPADAAPFRAVILSNWVCRSTDGGRTWTQTKEFPAPEQGWDSLVPFGPILIGDDGALHTTCYGVKFDDPAESKPKKPDGPRARRSWHFRSDDDGKSWRATSVLGPIHNETALFHLSGRNWLAAARDEAARAMDLFRSDDDGATWRNEQRVTARNELNAHLLRLKDGRLLMCYGNRVEGQFGALAKLSSDDGKTWGAPVRIMHSLASDCGYPSSVQRPDGKIVTAYYSKAVENHDRYHMGVAIWETPKNQ